MQYVHNVQFAIFVHLFVYFVFLKRIMVKGHSCEKGTFKPLLLQKGREMLEYKDRLNAFRSSARFYLENKSQYETLKSTSKNTKDSQVLNYLHDDISFVEKTLQKVVDLFGPGAGLIIYKLYVEGKTQSDVAEEYHMTRRQLQYSLGKWTKALFDEVPGVQ